MSDDASEEDTELEIPEPAQIEVRIDGEKQHLSYEKAFVLGCTLLEKGLAAEAAKLFERLEEFPDRGPRAFIMQAFCEAAALQFDNCSEPLQEAFAGDDPEIARQLHNAFVSYYVGVREDALKIMADLVNKHRGLPTLCLILGDMLESAGQVPMARRCWSLAVHRDRPGGAVAAVAMRHLSRTSER